MTSGPLPMFLLCVALGLTLSLAPRRAGWIGVAGLALSAILTTTFSYSTDWAEEVFVGLTLSVIATAALCYFRRGPTDRWLLAAGINAGAWTGAFATLSDQRAALLLAVPLGVLIMLGGRLISSSYPIVIKVVASWIIAIAALSLFVSLLPTPGYQPDHME